MKALLLLGLSRILQKKAQRLVDVDMSVDQGDIVDKWIEAVRFSHSC